MSHRKIAVVGATGNVGREILNILWERKFPADEVVALASHNSRGQKVSYGNKELNVQVLDEYDFTGTAIALFSPGGAISAIHAPRASAQSAAALRPADPSATRFPRAVQLRAVSRQHVMHSRRG